MTNATLLHVEHLNPVPGIYQGQEGLFCPLTDRAVLFVPCAQHGQSIILGLEPDEETPDGGKA